MFASEMKSEYIRETFGNIDIYLFDQLLKGTYDGCKTVLDAGCGTGRNLLYFLRSGARVYGIDQNPEAIAQLKNLASAFPHINPEQGLS